MRLLALATLLCTTVLSAGCTSPREQANMIAALNDAANEMNGMKSDFSALQEQVDSLQGVIAKQDTTITRMATFVNMPLAK